MVCSLHESAANNLSGMHPIPLLHKEWNGVGNEWHAPHSTPVQGVEWGGIQAACTVVRSGATRGSGLDSGNGDSGPTTWKWIPPGVLGAECISEAECDQEGQEDSIRHIPLGLTSPQASCAAETEALEEAERTSLIAESRCRQQEEVQLQVRSRTLRRPRLCSHSAWRKPPCMVWRLLHENAIRTVAAEAEMSCGCDTHSQCHHGFLTGPSPTRCTGQN